MARLEKIGIFSLPKTRIFGREVQCSLKENVANPVPALWRKSFEDGTITKFKSLPLTVADGRRRRAELPVTLPE